MCCLFGKKIGDSASKIKFQALDGSSKICVIIVKHNTDVLKVSPYLCVRIKCHVDYGTCDLFKVLKLESSEKRCRKRCTHQDFEESSDNDDAEEQRNDNEDEDENDCCG